MSAAFDCHSQNTNLSSEITKQTKMLTRRPTLVIKTNQNNVNSRFNSPVLIPNTNDKRQLQIYYS